jgi:glycosyltransferase involved in cell wall biosynthesis
LLLCRNLDRRVVLFSAGSAQRQTRSLHPRLELAELGMLSPVELAELYRACDLGVVPSLCWENFSTATIEMMSAGLCVLAANSGGIPENLEDQHTGWLIKNPNDVTEWAAALEKIIVNDKLRQRLARNARDYAAARFGVNNLEITGKWDQLLSSWVQTD